MICPLSLVVRDIVLVRGIQLDRDDVPLLLLSVTDDEPPSLLGRAIVLVCDIIQVRDDVPPLL